MTPADLLAAARDMLQRRHGATAGLWPRACALLVRQALECAIDQIWAADSATSALVRCTMRSQLSCLPTYFDAPSAREIAYVWAALSQACHYHAYELAPTAAELAGWIDTVSTLITRVEANARRDASPTPPG